jgi:hypothetical protein
MYDGAQWIPVAVLDATNNVARVAVDSAETSYITSTTAGQIRHVIANTTVATMRSTGLQFNIAAPVISDSNANELFSFTTVASAVNHIDIANAATGNTPTISAVGNDTNINIALLPKGAAVTRMIAETPATNVPIDVTFLEARSSGTPAAGIGAGLVFSVETAANNFEVGARIEAITTDVTATSEDFDLSFKVMAAGATAAEVMRIRSTGVVDVDALSIANVTVTSTAAELNILDGVTATTAELNILDGAIVSTNELNYLDSANSNIQTQLDAKAALASPALTGTPTAPTAATGTNTTQLATTAFVNAEIANDIGAAYAGLSALGVGSYVAAWNTTTTAVAVGGTIAGSSLRYVSANVATGSANDPFGSVAQSSSTFPTSDTTTLSGTWRAMTLGGGRITTGGGRSTTYRWNVSLWLRTA